MYTFAFTDLRLKFVWQKERLALLTIAVFSLPAAVLRIGNGENARASEPKNSDTSKSLSVAEVRQLLAAERHLSHRAIVLMGPNSLDYGLFRQQMEAIRQAGRLKLVDMVPALILHLDYPNSPLHMVATGRAWNEERYLKHARAAWPAFDAILTIGKEAVPHLEKFINDYTQDMKFRVAALAVLNEIDPERTKEPGKMLLMTIDKRVYPGGAQAIELVLKKGEHRFWGLPKLDAKVAEKKPSQ